MLQFTYTKRWNVYVGSFNRHLWSNVFISAASAPCDSDGNRRTEKMTHTAYTIPHVCTHKRENWNRSDDRRFSVDTVNWLLFWLNIRFGWGFNTDKGWGGWRFPKSPLLWKLLYFSCIRSPTKGCVSKSNCKKYNRDIFALTYVSQSHKHKS